MVIRVFCTKETKCNLLEKEGLKPSFFYILHETDSGTIITNCISWENFDSLLIVSRNVLYLIMLHILVRFAV